MAMMTVAMVPMKETARSGVRNINSNVRRLVSAFHRHGVVMAIKTALMDQMKTGPCALHRNAIMTHNFDARMDAAFQRCGIVIQTMTVAMSLMNWHISVEIIIVPMAGKNAPLVAIIAAFQHGCFVMGKMIAVTTQMRPIHSFALNVIRRVNFAATISGAFLSIGSVTLRMTVEINLTKIL